MKKKYLLVNVFGSNGYSFVIYGEYDENHESEVIDACLEHQLFQDEEDAEMCSVVEADSNDVKYFNSVGCVYDI